MEACAYRTPEDAPVPPFSATCGPSCPRTKAVPEGVGPYRGTPRLYIAWVKGGGPDVIDTVVRWFVPGEEIENADA